MKKCPQRFRKINNRVNSRKKGSGVKLRGVIPDFRIKTEQGVRERAVKVAKPGRGSSSSSETGQKSPKICAVPREKGSIEENFSLFCSRGLFRIATPTTESCHRRWVKSGNPKSGNFLLKHKFKQQTSSRKGKKYCASVFSSFFSSKSPSNSGRGRKQGRKCAEPRNTSENVDREE